MLENSKDEAQRIVTYFEAEKPVSEDGTKYIRLESILKPEFKELEYDENRKSISRHAFTQVFQLSTMDFKPYLNGSIISRIDIIS